MSSTLNLFAIRRLRKSDNALEPGIWIGMTCDAQQNIVEVKIEILADLGEYSHTFAAGNLAE